MPDSEGKQKTVKLNVRVRPSKKAEWQEQLEEGDTLSYVVREAVDKWFSDAYVPIEALKHLNGDANGDVDLSEVTERLDDLQGTIESLHREIDAVASVGSSYSQDRVSSVAMDLMDHIPEWNEGSNADPSVEGKKESKLQIVEDGLKADLQNERSLRLDGSTAKLAERVGESPALVRQALIYLEQRTTADIESIVVGGQRHWVQL